MNWSALSILPSAICDRGQNARRPPTFTSKPPLFLAATFASTGRRFSYICRSRSRDALPLASLREMRMSGEVLTTVPSTVSPTSSPSSSLAAITASDGPPYDTKASSPEIETICPLSNSPCSGVLKFRLASNASANVASAVSLLWVMDRKAFQWDGSQDGEIGWAAYLTRKSDRLGTAQRRRSCVSSAHVFSGAPIIEKY